MGCFGSTVEPPPQPCTKSDLGDISVETIFESASNDAFEQRLIKIMSKHKNVFVDNDVTDQNIIRFMDSFSPEYHLVDCLNDFDKYLEHDKANKSYAQNIYHMLIKNTSSCTVSKCNSIARYSRDQTKCATDNDFRASLYRCSKHMDDEQIVYHQLMDSIHVHLFHSFDMGYKLFDSEQKHLLDDKNDDNLHLSMLVNTIKNKTEIFRNSRNQFRVNTNYDTVSHEQTPNKFITTIANIFDSTSFIDTLQTHLYNNFGLQTVTDMYQYFQDEEYDTDSLYHDVFHSTSIDNRENSNILKRMVNLQLRDTTTEYLSNNDPYAPNQDILYSFGFRFYYWPFFKNNKNERHIIYTNEKGRKWKDRGNVGYKYYEWYIPPKKDNLKNEIIDNDVKTLSLSQFQTTIAKAQIAFQKEVSKELKANPYWETSYGIKHNTPVQLEHIVSLLLYCNYSDLCYCFSATYRKISKYESNTSLKSRHQNFYHFGRLLRELIEAYGSTFTEASDIRKFYHGISCEMYFKNCFAKVCGPMSTTISIEVASGIFAKEKGIVLQLKNDGATIFFMDCTKFSSYSNEDERLFIGGYQEIAFETIIKMRAPCRNYHTSVRIMTSVSRMLSGKSNDTKVVKKRLKKLKRLISYQTNENTLCNEKDDPYEVNLFKHFTINIKTIKIKMYFMSRDKTGSLTKFGTIIYGYKSLYDVFFNAKIDMIELPLIFKLFPQITTITIAKWLTIKYNENSDLSLQLMDYIFHSFESTTSKFTKLIISLRTVMNIENDQCTLSHPLQKFATETDTFICDKCEVKQEKGIEMYGCKLKETNCNYSICKSCNKNKNNFVTYLRNAIDKFQNKFNNISWKITQIQYKSGSRQIFDAICFGKIDSKNQEEKKESQTKLSETNKIQPIATIDINNINQMGKNNINDIEHAIALGNQIEMKRDKTTNDNDEKEETKIQLVTIDDD